MADSSKKRPDQERLARVERALGYRFKNKALLTEALTHSSVLQKSGSTETPFGNERLEFLGDAVLGLAISSILMSRADPSWDEGDLSRIRASLVNAESLAEVARELEIGDSIQVGRGERKDGGQSKTSILANTLEALLGAIFEDRGFDAAAAIINAIFSARLDAPLSAELGMDFKTILQERTQELLREAPVYRVVSESGPAHEREYEIEVVIDGHPVARGQGLGKKRASQEAARAALRKLETGSSSTTNGDSAS